MVNAYEFEKQFKNMGIDKEAILGTKKEAPVHNISASSGDKYPQNNEMQLLKRKLDYLTNMLLPKFEERFKAIEEKIDRELGALRNDKKDYVVLRNEVQQLKQQLKSIRIVFGDEPSSSGTLTEAPASFSSKNPSSQSPETPAQQKNLQPGDDTVRIDKIFNFSNHKF